MFSIFVCDLPTKKLLYPMIIKKRSYFIYIIEKYLRLINKLFKLLLKLIFKYIS